MDEKKFKILKDAIKAVEMHDPDNHDSKEVDQTAPMPSIGGMPTLRLDVKDAPFLKGYEVGDECMILVKTKICSHHAHDEEPGRPEENEYSLDILSIGQISHTPKGEEEEAGESYNDEDDNEY